MGKWFFLLIILIIRSFIFIHFLVGILLLPFLLIFTDGCLESQFNFFDVLWKNFFPSLLYLLLKVRFFIQEGHAQIESCWMSSDLHVVSPIETVLWLQIHVQIKRFVVVFKWFEHAHEMKDNKSGEHQANSNDYQIEKCQLNDQEQKV